jgi:hypothetical protein
MKKIGIVLGGIALTIALTAGSVFAQGNSPVAGNPGNPATAKSPTGFALNIRLQNPLKVSTIQDAIKFFVTTIVKIAIPVIIIFFLWSGLSFILARGNPTALKKARTMFFNTLIGALLILGAWTITNAIVGTVNSITG